MSPASAEANGVNGNMASQATSGSATVQASQSTIVGSANANSQTVTAGATGSQSQPNNNSLPRPRDARAIELLLLSQGVSRFDERVTLLLLDFAYRYTAGILNDAIHLTTDPYVSQASARPSGASGVAPTAPAAAEPVITANAINLAISSRQAHQFQSGGGASKDWMMDIARERNRQALPRLLANEWGVRLPNERFVLSGNQWDLKDEWELADEEESHDSDNDNGMGTQNWGADDDGDDLEAMLRGNDLGGDDDMDEEMME
ncbi:transcription initiation factor IID, 31kD subunit-domain-containing protein [Hypoxylon sp. NC1633]|nr:transcription initiation factor IID, 31kD subunit-domain-containing protein [Hypoxylon sp. NC1633]